MPWWYFTPLSERQVSAGTILTVVSVRVHSYSDFPAVSLVPLPVWRDVRSSHLTQSIQQMTYVLNLVHLNLYIEINMCREKVNFREENILKREKPFPFAYSFLLLALCVRLHVQQRSPVEPELPVAFMCKIYCVMLLTVAVIVTYFFNCAKLYVKPTERFPLDRSALLSEKMHLFTNTHKVSFILARHI